MDYVFPDHWSFLLGEIALYSFIVLIATGTFLALFFDPSTTQIVYHGGYAPLQGQGVSAAYSSTLHLSFDVSGRPADAPDPPLGGARVRRRDHAAPAADHLHRRVPQAARDQLPDRRDAARARDPRGVRRLLAARRPALRDGSRDRLGRGDVAAA